MGIDKYGNRYYQYYSHHGLPTSRVVNYKFFSHNKFHIDVHFTAWLHKRDLIPPSPEQLEQLYIDHDAFIERALNWDKEQKEMIEAFDRRKKELDQ